MKKKILSIALVMALASITIIGVTLAYFTDTTNTETNVFTVGNVKIHLTEPTWDPDNAHILPSVTIPKDPTISVDENSDDAWVFMDLEMNKYASFLKLVGLNEGWEDDEVWNNWLANLQDGNYVNTINKWFSDIDHPAWQVMNLDDLLEEMYKMTGKENPTTLTLQLGYKNVQKAGDAVTLFKALTIPGTVTSKMMEDSKFNTDLATWKLSITGKAIQAEGLKTLEEAYNALYTNP